MRFLTEPTRRLFFTGKGGVGKTSLACATAVALADRGRAVLLVSTDPASNLGQVFGIAVGDREPTPVPDVPTLRVLNINPEAAARIYRERIVGPLRGVLPAETLQGIEEQLSGACTTEIAAFDAFTGLLAGRAASDPFEHVIFDTAPTGHTLRLLQLPTAWTDYLRSNQSGASCLGPLAGLSERQQQYAQAVAELANRQQTTIVLVARPQRSSLAEAERTRQELAAVGIAHQQLVINGVMPDTGSGDPLAAALLERQAAALRSLPPALAALPRWNRPLHPLNMVGIAALRELLADYAAPRVYAQTPEPPEPPEQPEPPKQPEPPESPESPEPPEQPEQPEPHIHAEPPQATGRREQPELRTRRPLSELIDRLESAGHGLVMVLGKGGVGKTTVAAAIAVTLAARGHSTHLTTTDPAAHLSMTVETGVKNLVVSRIDPQAERERYRQHVMATSGQQLDDAGRQLLEEDLRSPCTEEIAVFQAFSRIMEESREKFVIVDTAPTGHTLLLLDATGSYHREMVRHRRPGEQGLTPLMLLQDSTRTKMVIVTLAETTPVLEAEALQADLRRAGIDPWAWVVNASLAAAAPTDPLLAARAREERPHLARVFDVAARVAVIPALAVEPVGSTQLLRLVRCPF